MKKSVITIFTLKYPTAHTVSFTETKPSKNGREEERYFYIYALDKDYNILESIGYQIRSTGSPKELTHNKYFE